MARIDFPALVKPLSEDEPCGPDLDRVGDEDYLNFVTIAEGLLPAEFFQDGVPFDATKLDADVHIARMAPLLARTRDIRLLALLARFLVLTRDLAGFARSVEAMALLLESYWDEVHPRADGSSFAMRAAAVATLNEPTVALSLQYIPLCEDRRFGNISLRARMFALGEAQPREGEPAPAYPTILQALRESPADRIEATREEVGKLADSLTKIHALFAQHCGLEKTPALNRVTGIAKAVMALLDEAGFKEGQKKADAGGAEAPLASGLIRSAFGARQALAAAIAYFARHEPSSPVLPLVAQARELQGKTFVEVMQTLLPRYADDAAYAIGDQKVFPLPLERLAALMPAIDSYAKEEETAFCPKEEPAVSDPVAREADSGEAPQEEPPGEAMSLEPAPPREGADMPSAPAAAVEANVPPPGRTEFSAATRKEAIALLNEVAHFLRSAEPSSPIPWLIDRAKALADRDFISVLTAVLPEDALREPGARR